MSFISLHVRHRLSVVLLALALPLLSGASFAGLPVNKLNLEPGFTLTVFSDDVPGARSLALGERGTLFVSTRDEGVVYALEHNGSKASRRHVLATDLNMPNGIAFRQGSLYVMEVNRLLRYDDIESQLLSPPAPVVVSKAFPSDSHHGWKFIRFGPDGKLYVPIGAPCNICDRGDPYASITRLSVTQSELPEIYARGIRNTVGFDWHPETHDLWFTDNGRDMLGDDMPPEELNRVSRIGEHFGYPYCHGGDIADPELGGKRKCDEFKPPEVRFQAHSAGLGMRFYTGRLFPPEYRHQIFIAQHGSWNRKEKVGYQVVRVKLPALGSSEKPATHVFVSGWLQSGGKVWGRPADVMVMPDGALLISDDQAGAIYRVGYEAH